MENQDFSIFELPVLIAQEELGGVVGCSWEVFLWSFVILQKKKLMIGIFFSAGRIFEKSEDLGTIGRIRRR